MLTVNTNKTIIHVSEVNISTESGMGRVEYYWKEAFESAGYIFLHIGPNEIGPLKIAAFFPYKAYRYFKKLNIKPAALIVHEPLAGFFVNKGIPVFVESHGVERRYWEDIISGKFSAFEKTNISLKTKILHPIWRLSGCDKGMFKAQKLLLINTDDKKYVMNKYRRNEEDIMVFNNGVKLISQLQIKKIPDSFVVLFNGTWVGRKGITTLINAAKLLFARGLKINYLLIGTISDAATVLNDWPDELRPYVEVVSRFAPDKEIKYLAMSSLFVLPSYAEGQPLSLLQAMAASKCCITTNCGGQKDVIIDKRTGFLFDVGDHDALASLITNCYENPYIIQRIGQNARRYIKTYTWENVSTTVVDYVAKNIA